MVNNGKAGSEISLDSINYRVSIGAACFELKPLTFALFAKLLMHKNEIVSIDALTKEVWGPVTVAPDTLKQRVFLLRKALEHAGIEDCHVQSVRGQGYRLVVPDSRPEETSPATRRLWMPLLAGALLLAFGIGYYGYSRQAFVPPSNARVVFWTSATDAQLSPEIRALQQQWITLLSSNGNIQYLTSKRDADLTLSAQARQTRAALISRWVPFDSGGLRSIRLQIIEPKTATSLRSDIVTVDDKTTFDAVLSAQADAIARILASSALPLTREALNDTDHPAWDELRTLAQKTESSGSSADSPID